MSIERPPQEGEMAESEIGSEEREQIERVLKTLETAKTEVEKAASHFEGKVTKKKRFRSPDSLQAYGEVLRYLERDLENYLERFRRPWGP